MLRSMFLLWIFLVLFGYGREANGLFRIFFGIVALGWIIRVLFFFGFGVLPMILLIALLSHVVIPFFRGFISRFR